MAHDVSKWPAPFLSSALLGCRQAFAHLSEAYSLLNRIVSAVPAASDLARGRAVFALPCASYPAAWLATSFALVALLHSLAGLLLQLPPLPRPPCPSLATSVWLPPCGVLARNSCLAAGLLRLALLGLAHLPMFQCTVLLAFPQTGHTCLEVARGKSIVPRPLSFLLFFCPGELRPSCASDTCSLYIFF